MDISTIKQKIDALNASVVTDSVSPEMVASILYDLLSTLQNITIPDDVLRTEDVRNSLMGNETNKPVSVALVNSLYSNGYKFMGIADTETTPYSNPEVIGLKLFYLAVEQGTYTKFGNKVKKSAASIMVLCSSDSGSTWTAEESADLSVKSNGSTVYDLTKIDALTGSSSSADVKAAFTPLSGGSSRSVPQVGDILRTNSTDYPYDDIVVYAQSTDNGEGIKSFKYLSETVIRTIQVMPDFSAVNVTETDLAGTGYEPKKYDYDKVMALSNESTELDKNEAFTPIGGREPSTPTPGDLLVSTDGRNNAIILARQQTTASNASIKIRYIYGNILRNISVRSSPIFSISVSEIELDKEDAGGGVLKINPLTSTNGSHTGDVGVTYQQLKDAISDSKIIMDSSGRIYAASGTDTLTLKNINIADNVLACCVYSIPSYSGTTVTYTTEAYGLANNIIIPTTFLSGSLNGTDESIKFPDMVNAVFYGSILDDTGVRYNAYMESTREGIILTALKDATTYASYTVGMSDNGGLKLTARTTTPIAEPHVDFELQSFESTNLCIICDTGTILNTDEIAFFRHKKSRNFNETRKGITHHGYRKKSGWIRPTDNSTDVYNYKLPMSLAVSPYTIAGYAERDKDVWLVNLTQDDKDVSGFDDFYEFCQYYMTRSNTDVLVIRTGYGDKKLISASDSREVTRTLKCGIAVYRGGKRISDIKPFKIVFIKVSDAASTMDGITSSDIRVTFRV